MMRHGVFVLVAPPTPEDAAAVRDVLDVYRFPWQWTVAHCRLRQAEIRFEDRPGSTGFYDREANRLHVDPVSVRGAAETKVTLAHELGHFVDDAVLGSDVRGEIHRLMHDGSPVAVGDCPATGGLDLDPGSSAVWFGGKTAHTNRPFEAFAFLAARLWCPPYAESKTSYGPHLFTHAEKIRELVMAYAETRPPFTDVDGHTFQEDIEWAAGRGIFLGGTDGRARPDEPVTRGQMCAFLRRALDKESTT